MIKLQIEKFFHSFETLNSFRSVLRVAELALGTSLINHAEAALALFQRRHKRIGLLQHELFQRDKLGVNGDKQEQDERDDDEVDHPFEHKS